MPMYEYQCQSCGFEFEERHMMKDMLQPEGVACPDCEQVAVKKVILTAPGLGDPVRLGRIKPPGDFKEVLHKIHENTPGSRLKDTATHY